MILLLKKIFLPGLPQNKYEFLQTKFMRNNLFILLLSAFLTVEQIYYGLCVREDGSLIQKIHFFSAIALLFYVFVGLSFHIKKPRNISWMLRIYEIGFGFFGFFVAILRALLVQDNICLLPPIYIAVIYGFAVIFYFHPLNSLFVYATTSFILIMLLPAFNSEIIQSSYIQDIISNNIIAWIVSVINYNQYVKQFINQKIINQNNQELKEKALQIERMNDKLRDISTKDFLTNIYNRRKLDEMIEQEYYRAIKKGTKFSIILIDLDFFKSVNDTYGHSIGDKILIETAKLLESNIRSSDMVGRWGGEEFLIICPKTNIEQALCISEKLRKNIANYKFSVVHNRTSSFGVATYENGDTISGLIGRADKGLYQAKENGRNRVEICGHDSVPPFI